MNDACLFFGGLAAIVMILFFIIAVLSGDAQPRCQVCDEYLEDGEERFHTECYLEYSRAWLIRWEGGEKNG